MKNLTEAVKSAKVHILGQVAIQYKTPKDIINELNSIYDDRHKETLLWKDHLVGKIKKQYAIYSQSVLTPKENKNNLLSQKVIQFFKDTSLHYLKLSGQTVRQYKLCTVWINEMEEHEYNPIHTHEGDSLYGLSSVMFLKLPKEYGTEITRENVPRNGRLQLIANSNGQFASSNILPDMNEGDFWIFPYDVRHCVYPFTGNEIRRTLSANFDVDIATICK